MKVDSYQPKHPGGRPLKFQSVVELNRAIAKYFRDCDPHWVYKQDWVLKRKKDGSLFKDTNGQNVHVKLRVRRQTEQQPYTIAGLAVALGVSRQTLLSYSERPEFMDSIRAAKSRCEAYWEGLLATPAANGAKFNLINNYRGKHQDWSEKSEIDHNIRETPAPLLGGTTALPDEDDEPNNQEEVNDVPRTET